MYRQCTCWLAFLTLLFVTPHATMAQQQLIEVRFYHFQSEDFAAEFDQMMAQAAIPLMEKHQVGPVGVFQVADSPELGANARVTIVPYDSMEQMLKMRQAFNDDESFLRNAEAYLDQETGKPPYDRVESMLLQAFSGMPQLKVPGTGEDKQRLFELRTYKSENEVQGVLKVQMFHEGEMEIFTNTGLNAVFYGDAVIAPNLPQLTYLLVHEDQAAKDKAWQTFIGAPEWKALSSEPKYQVIKLKITRHMLKATDASQIR